MYTYEEAEAFIDRNTWVFAKTMRDTPHWYLMRDRATSREEYLEFGALVWQDAVVKPWRGRRHRYLQIRDREYFLMGPPHTQIVINCRDVVPPVWLDGLQLAFW